MISSCSAAGWRPSLLRLWPLPMPGRCAATTGTARSRDGCAHLPAGRAPRLPPHLERPSSSTRSPWLVTYCWPVVSVSQGRRAVPCMRGPAMWSRHRRCARHAAGSWRAAAVRRSSYGGAALQDARRGDGARDDGEANHTNAGGADGDYRALGLGRSRVVVA
jgi:hypothetical protein